MNDQPDNTLQKLLLATANGDGQAFQALYDSTCGTMNAVAVAIVRDRELAEDALQDAYVQVWHKAADYHAERGGVLTWMTTIVRYRAIDLLRKRTRGGSTGSLEALDIDASTLELLLSGDPGSADEQERGPLASAIASEEAASLRDCLSRLSGNQQRSVILAFFRGFTHQELAECLVEPLGTVKSRLRRSLVRLKECLTALGGQS